MKYIATYNPQRRGRLGIKLYEKLIENNGSGLSLPIIPSIHGVNATSRTSHGLTPRYSSIRRNTAFPSTLLITSLLKSLCRVVGRGHRPLPRDYLTTIRVVQEHLSARAGRRSGYES
ncbi:hypothetical protein BC827DRAFT_866357 [Russula dissimulans]|nr:hypothetical protein BC827DRAFT_866357 [Russula dissimulans]